MNSILIATEAQVKHWFATGFVAVVDRVFGRLDDVLAMWSAWNAPEIRRGLQRRHLRSSPALHCSGANIFAKLEELVGFAGRGLLIPTATDL